MANDPYTGWTAGQDSDDGAFAVESDVSWTNGFGDEDLAGNASKNKGVPRPGRTPVARQPVRQPVRHASTAPVRPTAAPAQAAPGQAPAGVPTPSSALPAAPVVTAPQPPVQPAPANLPLPPAPAPAPQAAPPSFSKPVLPAQPAATAPAPAAPPVTLPAAPVAQPAPASALPAAPTVPTVPAQPVLPVATPPAAPSSPTVPGESAVARLEAAAATTVTTPFVDDYAPPAPSVPSTPMYDNNSAPAGHASTYLATAPEEPDATQGKPKPWDAWKKPKTDTSKPAPTRKPGAARVPRDGGLGRKIWRTLAFGTIIVLALSGLKNVVAPTPRLSLDYITQQVAQKTQAGFPLAAASGFAEQFAKDYLTYTDKQDSEKRNAMLARYSPSAANGDWGWVAGKGKQSVVAGPFVAGSSKVLDKNRAVITVTAQVNSGRWVYLAVPVYAESSTSMLVYSAPSFVPAPISPKDGAPAQVPTPGDQDLGTLLQTQLFEGKVGFFTAWAASDPTALERLTTPDATQSAKQGLQGAFTLSAVQSVDVEGGTSNTRLAQVRVTWANPYSGLVVQDYVVQVFKNSEGTWIVRDIYAGTRSDKQTTTPVVN